MKDHDDGDGGRGCINGSISFFGDTDPSFSVRETLKIGIWLARA